MPRLTKKLKDAANRSEVAAPFTVAGGHTLAKPRSGEHSRTFESLPRQSPLGFVDPFLVGSTRVSPVRYEVDQRRFTAPCTPPLHHVRLGRPRLRNGCTASHFAPDSLYNVGWSFHASPLGRWFLEPVRFSTLSTVANRTAAGPSLPGACCTPRQHRRPPSNGTCSQVSQP